jgi:small-conductance mechanosensitive channel
MERQGLQAFLSDVAARADELAAHAPAWAIDIAALALAILVALALHAILIAAARRVVDAHAVFLSALLAQTRGPTRLALIIIALSIAVAAIPLGPSTAAGAHHALLIAFIILAGWIGVIAVRSAEQIYSRRLRGDPGGDPLTRKHLTQVRILEQTITVLIVIVTAACVLITFESVREYGVSLFASAGIAGVIAGLAARPVLSNLFAGLQIAIAQPIRLEDAVIVENEWGRVEEITGTYVVVRLWDWRRLIVPLSYFIEKPFQNWTRHSPALIGSVMARHDIGEFLAHTCDRHRVIHIMGRPGRQPPGHRRQERHHRITCADERRRRRGNRGFALRSAGSADRVSATRISGCVAEAARRGDVERGPPAGGRRGAAAAPGHNSGTRTIASAVSIFYSSSMSPAISTAMPTPPTVSVTFAGSASFPFSRPFATASRTAFSISRCEVMPTFFKKRLTLVLRASSFMTSLAPAGVWKSNVISAQRELVSRFRSSPEFAACSEAKLRNRRTLATL